MASDIIFNGLPKIITLKRSTAAANLISDIVRLFNGKGREKQNDRTEKLRLLNIKQKSDFTSKWYDSGLKR